MLGNHEGISPLNDKSAVAHVLLRTMGRLKAGKDVAFRRALISRALERTNTESPYWVEDLVANLTGDDAIESIPAHLAAFAAGWADQERDVARIIRNVNKVREDPFLRQAVMGFSAAAPEFGKRLKEKRLDSDEFFLRVALAHFFRRNPSDTFQMFVIDGIVRQIRAGLKISVQDLVKSCLERFEEEPLPDGVWGFLLVLSGATGRGGYLLQRPTEDARQRADVFRARLQDAMGDMSDIEALNHAGAAFYSRYYQQGDEGSFQNHIAPFMEASGHRCGIFYAREDSNGVHSEFIPIPTDDPNLARRFSLQMPQVSNHDEMRDTIEAALQMFDRLEMPLM